MLAMETLHPQWSGYGYTWRRDLNAIEPEQYVHGSFEDADLARQPLQCISSAGRDGGEDNPSMRRRLETGPDQRDFPVLEEFFAAGRDGLSRLPLRIRQGHGDRSQGTGIVYSFATDRRGGFSDDDTTLLQATLPALSLAMKAHAGYVIASGLLGTYLGEDAGRRVHAGSIMRGSVDNLRAVIWYADIRGFTPISDAAPGRVVVELLNEVFEILTASLRPRGGQVLKFIGDGMLAIFSFEERDRAETCRRALDAAIEAMRNIDELNNGARGGRRSGRLGRSRPPSRRGALRQCRRDRPARLHRHRPGRQRSRAHRGVMRAARPRGSRLGRIRRRHHAPTTASSRSAATRCAA